jgi:glycosyltransferase involved in cell wall biosynthesis
VDGEFELSVIIPTCPERERKLRTLLEGIAQSSCDHSRFEVILVVDDENDGPLQIAENLLNDIHFQGLTQPHGGPAKARNFAISQARGAWLLFLDDDVRVEEDTIGRHLQQIRWNPEAEVAHLGCSLWPRDMTNSPWQQLLAKTSMIFFWDNIHADKLYGFRYFWTYNLSVRTDFVREIGGFCEEFPYAMHEDIELGWRLQKQFGLKVHPMPEVISWHDHELSPRDYFFREYRGGKAARIARDIAPAFYNEVWGWMDDPDSAGGVLNTIFERPVQEVRQLLKEWSVPSDHCPTDIELRAMYLAHLPLKRMAFCQGFAGKPFEDIWDEAGTSWKQDQSASQTAAI